MVSQFHQVQVDHNPSISNGGIYFPSKTNSTSLELKSTIGTNMSNSLLMGYTTVRDDRDPIGSDFPFVRIIDGTGVITFGSEAFSTGNQLNSDVFTVLNKFQLYKGKHNLMLGFDAEFGSFYNLFIRQNYGQYQFGSIADFYANNPNRYDRSYSLVDDVTGDGSKAAAEFSTSRVGLFISDKYEFNDKFTLTAGIRLDGNYFPSQPTVDQKALDYWNNVAKPVISSNYELDGAEAGQMPSGKFTISPRLGFNYDVNGDKNLQIRGGSGIFFGRIPMVWPGGAYSNSGAIIGGVGINRPTAGWANVPSFNPDINKQYDAGFFGQSVNIPSGELNLIADDFKLPSILRSSLGIDKKFDGWKFTLEGMLTQNFNDIEYNNVNIAKPNLKSAGADQRIIYSPTANNPVKLDFDPNTNGIQNQYNNNVFLLKNASINGNSWNVTAQIEKTFFKDLQTSFSYTYGESKILNEVTSSQNSSQWRYIESINGRNFQTLSYSDFDLGHRVVGYVSYAVGTTNKSTTKNIGSTAISLLYTGQSGNRFSYVYANSLVNDWARTEANDLIFVPATKDQIVFKDATSADAQWAALDKYIKEDEYLNSRRGNYAERNGSRSPFQHSLDLKLTQDINLFVGKKSHTLQISLDIFNFTNILNSKWGRQYFVNNDNFRLLTFEGFKDAAKEDYTPMFSFKTPTTNPWTINDGAFNSSRWSGQFGIRYIFN
ncbi:MAG: TonB-dependent receptor [Saprospiraceae bacterium]|nr:TonB-dependent receptor [Saprospiraceae bacterium]